MDIRPITTADRPGLVALIRSDTTFRADEVDVAIELIDAAIARTGDYWIWVAVRDDLSVLTDGLAGYLCCGPTPMTESTYDLYWIVTHAAARGRGVARALILTMEQALRERGGTAVRVETSEQDSYGAARRLYAGLDYPEVARLSDFYAPGDGLVLYYKKL
ncbi:N-acetyltransferase family protein [Haliangium sp.]|uniref:GNAT family N-acetyltransferase n=1 Tax=Haliangium sp. TaxID=2663208 RepID=UPI003D0D39A1